MSAKKITTKDSDNRDDVLVDVGPTLHRRTLIAASCYRAGIPDHVKRLMEKIPELAQVIVPLADVRETRRRASELGTEENRICQYLRSIRFGADGEVRA